MSIYRARLSNTSNALSPRVSSVMYWIERTDRTRNIQSTNRCLQQQTDIRNSSNIEIYDV